MTLEQTSSSDLTLDLQELQKETTLTDKDPSETCSPEQRPEQKLEPEPEPEPKVAVRDELDDDKNAVEPQEPLGLAPEQDSQPPVLDRDSVETEIKGDDVEKTAPEAEEESCPTPPCGLLTKNLEGAAIQEKERTLGFIRNLDMHDTDNTIKEIKNAGFNILHRRPNIQLTLEQAQILYQTHSARDELALGLISGPVEGIVLEKEDAVNAWRIFAGLDSVESVSNARQTGVIYASTCAPNVPQDIELVLAISDTKDNKAEDPKDPSDSDIPHTEQKPLITPSSTKPTVATKPEKKKGPGESSLRKPSKLGSLQKIPLKQKKENEKATKDQKPSSASRLKQPGFQVTISTGLLTANKTKSPTSASSTSPASATSLRGTTGIARPTSRRPSVIQTEDSSRRTMSATTTKTPPMPRVVMMAHKNASERTKVAETKKVSPKASRGALARLTAPTAASTRKQAPVTSPSSSPLTPKTPTERLIRTTKKTTVVSAVSDISVVVPPATNDKSGKSPKVLQTAKKNGPVSVSRIGKPASHPEGTTKQPKPPTIAKKFAIHLPRVQPAKPKVTTDVARAAVPEKSSDLKSVRSHLESGKEVGKREKPLGYLKKPSTKVSPLPPTKPAKKVEAVTAGKEVSKEDPTIVAPLNPTESQEIQKSSEASSVSSSRPVTPEGIQNMPSRPKIESTCLTETQTA
ncbi:hypothetical protein CLU79DRAFT_747506 [Phycomyces nitens]|nr:hypothetical protein CLU79DRAFT_747506 [Phycomyces nitens]